MREYRLDPDALEPRKRMIILRIAVPGFVGVLFFAALIAYRGGTPSIAIPGVALVTIVLALTVTKALRQLEREWETFRIFYDEDLLVVRSALQPERRIEREQVREIAKVPGKGLVIYPQLNTPIVAPIALAQFSELEESLESWVGNRISMDGPPGSLEEIRRRRDRLVTAASCALLACWLATAFAPLWVAAGLGLVMLGLAAYVAKTFEKLPVAPRYTKAVKRALGFMVLAAPARVVLDLLRRYAWGFR